MADANAARNIASRAAIVSPPYLSRPLYPQAEHPYGINAQEEARARFQAKAVPLLGAAVAYLLHEASHVVGHCGVALLHIQLLPG